MGPHFLSRSEANVWRGVMTSRESLPHREVRGDAAWPQGWTVRSPGACYSRQHPVFKTHGVQLLGLRYFSSSCFQILY